MWTSWWIYSSVGRKIYSSKEDSFILSSIWFTFYHWIASLCPQLISYSILSSYVITANPCRIARFQRCSNDSFIDSNQCSFTLYNFSLNVLIWCDNAWPFVFAWAVLIFCVISVPSGVEISISVVRKWSIDFCLILLCKHTKGWSDGRVSITSAPEGIKNIRLKIWPEQTRFKSLPLGPFSVRSLEDFNSTLSGLNFAWINFRDFRVFWLFSRNFLYAKFLKLQFLPKPPGKWKKLGEKQADSRNLVHAKIFDLRFAKFCPREN